MLFSVNQFLLPFVVGQSGRQLSQSNKVCICGGGEELCRDCLGVSVSIGVVVIPTAWWVCLATSHAAACPCPVYLCTMTCIVSCRTQDIFNEILTSHFISMGILYFHKASTNNN